MSVSSASRGLAAVLLTGAMSSDGVAQAGVVRVQVAVSPDRDRGEPPGDGLWRIDNGIVPVVPKTVDLRSECLVLLQPRSDVKAKETKKEETVTVEVRGLRLSPNVVAVPVGGTLEMKNEDRVPHALHTAPPDETIVPLRATPAGTGRVERVQRPGVYTLLDDEQPHVRGWIVVTDRAFAVRTDERGAARADVPDGRYTLRLFYHGGYVVERDIDVGAKPIDVALTLPPRSSAKHEPTADAGSAVH